MAGGISPARFVPPSPENRGEVAKELDGSEISTLEDEIESLDRDIINLGVPMKHSDLYFMIKSHLNLVRTRIGLRRTDLRGKKEDGALSALIAEV